jgi:hypothetical protein
VKVLAAAATTLLCLLTFTLVSPPALATHLSFGQPSATAVLGQALVFSTNIDAAEKPQSVEVLLSLPAEPATTVLTAQVTGGRGEWQAVATLERHTPPNTRLDYRFRIRDAEGTSLGPAAQVVVSDDRFEWRTVAGEIVRLHWYEGSEAFGQRALEIGERAIANASELLGVQETEPIDFFIYDGEEALRGALGPATRENVAGQANADIRTMFGAIEPFEVDSDWVDTLVTHELTHLVFDTATANRYHVPPRWLNEGVAVYLSEGYNGGWRSVVESAARDGSLVPLDGLAGLFPTTALQFQLAYGESVSAIDFFVRTHEEQTLWDLVRGYAQGISDDEAFRTATGAGLAEFNEAWMASLGVDVPQPLGPQPGQPGPLPAGWDVVGQPTESPAATGASPTASAPASPRTASPTARLTSAPSPTPAAEPGDDGTDLTLVVAAIGLIAALALLLGLLLAGRQRRSPPPTPPGI